MHEDLGDATPYLFLCPIWMLLANCSSLQLSRETIERERAPEFLCAGKATESRDVLRRQFTYHGAKASITALDRQGRSFRRVEGPGSVSQNHGR
jgi:hypothetical protein